MPNKKAKNRKSDRRKKNLDLKRLGRTANQVKKFKLRRKDGYKR